MWKNKQEIVCNRVQCTLYLIYKCKSLHKERCKYGRWTKTVHLAEDSMKNEGKKIWETGLKKFGAMLGDCVEVGCGSVLNPGSVIGKNTNIYPLSSVRGVVPENSIYKNQNEIVVKK